MFFRKKKKKRVVCGASAILAFMQEAIDMDISSYFIVSYAGQKHTLGMTSDFELGHRGKRDKETGRWANVKFHLDECEFDTFEQFKLEARFGEELFANIQGDIDVLEACSEVPHIYPVFENYIVIDE